jgi:hypothetical protein
MLVLNNHLKLGGEFSFVKHERCSLEIQGFWAKTVRSEISINFSASGLTAIRFSIKCAALCAS